MSTARISRGMTGKSLDPISCIFCCLKMVCRRVKSLDFTAFLKHSGMNGNHKNLPHICPMCPIFAP